MKKADIILEISKQTGIAKVDILVTLETFFLEVKQAVLDGQSVTINGFGCFTTVKRAFKVGRNIKEQTFIEIPEHYLPKFKPAKQFMDAIRSVEIKPQSS